MNDYTDAVLKFLPETSKPFHPYIEYNKEGDCVEFVAKPDDFYGERIDGLVTVYYSRENQQIVGSLIKGYRLIAQSLSEKLPGFQITISDGSIKLHHIFLAKAWSETDRIKCLSYNKLAEMAEKLENEIDTVHA